MEELRLRHLVSNLTASTARQDMEEVVGIARAAVAVGSPRHADAVAVTALRWVASAVTVGDELVRKQAASLGLCAVLDTALRHQSQAVQQAALSALRALCHFPPASGGSNAKTCAPPPWLRELATAYPQLLMRLWTQDVEGDTALDAAEYIPSVELLGIVNNVVESTEG
jgi:hypothetical protein